MREEGEDFSVKIKYNTNCSACNPIKAIGSTGQKKKGLHISHAVAKFRESSPKSWHTISAYKAHEIQT